MTNAAEHQASGPHSCHLNAPERSATKMRRVLNPAGVVLLTFSALSPASAFFISGDALLHLAGTGAPLAFLAGGLAQALLALLYSEIGAAYPRAGGTYPGLAALLGPAVTFPYVVITIPTLFASVAFISLGLGNYVRVLAPEVPLFGVSALAMLLACGIAVLNIRIGALVTGAFLALEMVALAAIAVVGALHPVRPLPEVLLHPVLLDHGALAPLPFAALALAFVSGIWATGGASMAICFAEEMHEAQRKIGRVVAWTGAIAVVVISGPMIVMVLAIDDLPGVLGAESPIAAFLQRTGGPVLASVVSAGVIAAIFNCLIATLMAAGRVCYATGRDGLWIAAVNRTLGSLHAKFGSPVAATLIITAMSLAALCAGERALLIFISGNVSDFILVSMAILIGRRRRQTGHHFKAPLHPFLPLFGFGIAGAAIVADWMDVETGRPSILLLTGIFFAAAVYFRHRLREASARWLVAEVDAPTGDPRRDPPLIGAAVPAGLKG